MIRDAPVRAHGRLAGVPVQDTSSFGCLGWPICVAGGFGCPDPNGFGASLNPCCHYTPPEGPCPDSVPAAPSTPVLKQAGEAITSVASSAASNIFSTSSSDWLWMLSIAGLAALLVIEELKRR
jgi:hypothetical protein